MAITHSVIKRLETWILFRLTQLPVVSLYVQIRGWPFVIAWIHRIFGILLAIYVLFHIYTLSYLETPALYDDRMKLFRFFIFAPLEWMLAIPVIFHTLNGSRLILYESFGRRNDESMIRWLMGISIAYLLFLGLLMLLGNQSVTPVFFWLTAGMITAIPMYLVTGKIRKTGMPLGWKLQRITGAFLLICIPAHFLFMHLQPSVGHEADVVMERMQKTFIKFVDAALVLNVLYHGGYGILAITKDYLESKALQTACAVIIFLVMIVFAWIGIRLTLTV
jgi:succinate dehydrogenase hydrophobic membrane anchor protein